MFDQSQHHLHILHKYLCFSTIFTFLIRLSIHFHFYHSQGDLQTCVLWQGEVINPDKERHLEPFLGYLVDKLFNH